MNHRQHRKYNKSMKRRLKRMAAAAAVAGAAFVSSALLPGVPATAHASAIPDGTAQPGSAIEHVVKTPKGNFNFQSESRIPLKKLAKAQAKAKAQAQAEAQAKAAARAQAKAQNERDQQARTPVPKDTAAPQKQAAKTVQASPTAAKAPTEYQQVLNVKATAYAPGPHDNDQWGDKTFIGSKVRPGVIAVDPNVIPLGSRVYIQYPDGTGHYATAEDTGGAIKGNRIDIAMRSVDQAYDFGIKNVKVYVLGKNA
ncbi:hypothetical protein SCACP_08870 [Sporomusa carbonis]|uniref:3D domain-containing protein n=1 Tax=Sporomusa carbonis TaxID=3076075 RepID=UPI003A69E95A